MYLFELLKMIRLEVLCNQKVRILKQASLNFFFKLKMNSNKKIDSFYQFKELYLIIHKN